MRKPFLPTLVVLAAASLAALTGCSAPAAEPAADPQESTTSQAPSSDASPSQEAAGGEQTVAESCAIAQQALQSVQSEMSGALQGVGSGDIAGVVAALETFEATLGETVDEVTNPEVDAALSDFQSKFASFNGIFAEAQNGGPESLDQTALQTASTELQESAQGMQELCT